MKKTLIIAGLVTAVVLVGCSMSEEKEELCYELLHKCSPDEMVYCFKQIVKKYEFCKEIEIN